jgi:hypothetical protein
MAPRQRSVMPRGACTSAMPHHCKPFSRPQGSLRYVPDHAVLRMLCQCACFTTYASTHSCSDLLLIWYEKFCSYILTRPSAFCIIKPVLTIQTLKL